ncbi:hypothetical protein SEPCBS57363_003903 [Sporothrix epigloea]|uniref:2EXR domain-containing protein n=1 Tax=Sporothrix epigloea TaxID=1892477 RepID=A0ABP0DT90_9PEZI
MNSFRYFQDLPAELRIKIWRMSRQPRVVEVWYDADVDCCQTTSRPPAILHVNREARAEAMHQGWYRRAFRTRSRPRDHYIYFSSALDVLYLPRHGLMGYDDAARDFAVHVRDTVEHVRALAIDHVRADTIRPWEPYNKLMLLFSFPHIQETILVVAPSSLPASSTSPTASPPRSSSSSSSSSSLSASYDRRVYLPRSQKSIENGGPTNAASPSSPMSSLKSSTSPKLSATAKSTEKGDVELVDPQGDALAVMGVIDNVIESFSRVIEDMAVANNGETASILEGNDSLAIRSNASIPSLIPKAIAYQQQCHRQQQRQRRATLTGSRVVEA